MRASRCALLLGAFVAVAGGIPSLAAAGTWPVARHDAARTGASTGVCPIEKPLVAWRAFMGGRPTDPTARFGLGNPEMLVAAVGGRFVALSAVTQATLWKSDILGVGVVEDIADLDGDGVVEVVARTETRVFVLDGKTGVVRWGSPEGPFRTPAAARVIDLDGDGLSDVYIDECASCAKPGDMVAGAYSFAAGLSSPQTLWTRSASAAPPPAHTGTDGIVDLDGDGLPEIVLTSSSEIVVLRGSDGALLTTLSLPNATGKPFPHARPIAAELDGLPGKELVLVVPEGQIAGEVGPAGVTAFRVDPKAGTGSLLYRRVAADHGDTMVDLADVVSDLDGDGIDEIVVSRRAAASGVYTTEILKGAAGTAAITLANARFEGAADFDGNPGAELVLASADGLSVHHFDPAGLSLLAGPVTGQRSFSLVDRQLSRRGALDRRLAVLPRPGSSAALIVGEPAGDASYAELGDVVAYRNATALALGPGGFVSVGKHAPLVGEVTGLFRADFATRPYPQMALGTSAGTVVVLDQKLGGTNGIVFWGGMATGSYVGGAFPPSAGARGGPLVGEDPSGPFVVLPDSPLGLVVGDARFASWILPPLPRFIARDMYAASVVDLGPLGTAVVGAEEHSLVARRSIDGTSLGEVDLGPGTPEGTPLPLVVAGEAAPRVGLDWRVEGVAVAQSIVDFTSGKLVHQSEPLLFGGFFGSGVGDLDGDGTDEWYSMNNGLNRRDVVTGAVTTLPGENMFYSLPMLAQFRAGKGPELLLQAGASAPRLLDAGLKAAWQSTSPENVNGMAGARVLCADAARFVGPSVLSPFLRAYDGATGALLGERVLAGGSVFPSLDAAKAAGARPGVLSNTTSVATLGQGGSAVLVGSTDGHLYALDACTLALRWSKMLGAPVAEPIVGDTDGDGEDEIVVGVADGSIVALDVPHCAPPAWVSFVGYGQDEPITLTPGQKPSISFAPVPEAKAYEYALVGPDERAIWSPAYRDAPGSTFDVDITGVLAARPYRIAVRARGANGSSPDVFSPPFVVNDTTSPAITEKLDLSVYQNQMFVRTGVKDDLALGAWMVRMRDDSGEWLVAGDGLLDGPEAKLEAKIAPPAAFYGKTAGVRIDLLDSAGNTASFPAEALVGVSGEIIDFGFSVKKPQEDSVDPATGSIAIEKDFFRCGASGRASSSGSGAIAALGLALGLARRARRRPS